MTAPVPVTHVVMGDDLQTSLDAGTARSDDAYWLRFVSQPLTPQRFLTWWISRRWVMPRDVRKH